MALPVAPRTGQAITDDLRRRMKSGETFPYGTCLRQQRVSGGIPSHDYTPGNGRDPWAIEAWDNAHFKHPEKDPLKIPANVYVFWRGAAGRPGHIAHTTDVIGRCITTDIPTKTKLGDVYTSAIHAEWGMDLLGWTEDLNEYRAWLPPKPPSAWSVVRPKMRAALIELLAVANSKDARAVPARRTAIRSILAASRAAGSALLKRVNATPME